MADLNPEEIAQALMALTPFEIRYRPPNDRVGITKGWYVHQKVSVRNEHTDTTKYGNGDTPIEALIEHWKVLTSIKENEYLFVRDGELELKVRWGGFMWQLVR